MTRTDEAKLVLLGAANVGKTSIITRAVADFYDPAQEPTITASFSVKMVRLENHCVRLLIWDTAGQEQYRTLGPLYYHGARAIVIVFSLVDRDSLTDAERWADSIKNHCDIVPHLYLVGNKADLIERRAITREEGIQTADKIGASYTETSVVRGQNINELFSNVAEHLCDSEAVSTPKEELTPERSECDC
jgi:small GTP-binding protein